MSSGPARALLGIGEVRHTRLRPVRHAFAYPTYFLLLPMRSLRERPEPALRRNRFGLLSFHDADHGDGRSDSLAWLDALLHGEGIADAAGEIWLHCYPRILGFTFKPVSFWYCHRADGPLAAVVVEVNNTFGERHCYLLAGPDLAFGRELRATKDFHVSPFCAVAGDYRFRFLRTDLQPSAEGAPNAAARIVARVDHHDAVGVLLKTSLSGALAPLVRGRILAAFVSIPLLTLGVVARIHWQALKLWCKRVPFRKKPEPPQAFVTR
ncbi:MAG: DUF1365 domain-containing protein [Burkholderiales bacterium]|nr:DUF1365 domain-containing protein [Burkholderiales bacterium]